MIVCRNCGHANPEGTEFCENCKSFLEFTGERVGSTSGTDTGGIGPGTGGTGATGGTSGGGTPLGGGGTPLGGGGRPVDGGPGSGGTGPTGPTGAGGPIGGQQGGPGTAGTDPSMIRCPRCGTLNEPGRVFCKFCGERLAATAPLTPTAPRARFAVDPKVAIGAALVVLAIGAAAVFALVLSGQKPAATASPSGVPSTAPTGSDTAVASATPGGSVAPSARPSSSAVPTPSPSGSVATPSVAPSVTPVTPSVAPTSPPPTPLPIAFYAVRNGQADIFTVPPAGGPIANLTQDAPADSDPKWSPDGTRLAFDSRRVDGQRNIWVREPDGITFTRLTEDTSASNSFPSWSPAGAAITWARDGEIWVMNLGDRSSIQLTAGADDSRPSWSTSGLIVFGRTTPGNHTIWTVPSDQSEAATVLIDVPEGGGRQPSWSPDGKRIAYVRLQNGVLRIWVAAANGGSRKVVTPGSPCPCQYPTWSPDGKSIAFQAGVAKKEQIYVVPAAGGTPRRVTDGSGQNLVPGWGT